MTTEPKSMASTEAARPLSGAEILERAMQGFQAYEQGQYEEARAIFNDLAARDASEGYYRTALGAICLAVDELDNALGYFNEALSINPEDCAALVNRGEVNLRLGNIIQAAQDFSRVVELDPENKDPLTERARVLAAAALQSAEEAQSDSSGGQAEG